MRTHFGPIWSTCSMLHQRSTHQETWLHQRSVDEACPASWPHRRHGTNHAHPWPKYAWWTTCWAPGVRLWLDVKIHTVAPELSVAKELLTEEQTKWRAYGQREGYNLQALDKGMTPVVLEQCGRTAPGAQTRFNRIIHHCLQLLVPQRMPFSTPRGLPAPSCGAPHPARCLAQFGRPTRSAPSKIGLADLGDTPPSLPDLPGEFEWMSGWRS